MRRKVIPTSEIERTIHEMNAFIRKNAPFSIGKNEVLYLSSSKDTFVDSFIQENLSQIEELFAKKDYIFTYLPNLTNPERIRYNFPFLKEEETLGLEINVVAIEAYIIRYLSKMSQYPCLIRSKGEYSSGIYNKLGCYPLTSDLLWEQFELYSSNILYNGSMFSKISFTDWNEPKDKGKADKEFEKEAHELIREIKEKVFRLRQIGIGEHVLEQILLNYPPTLSRLVITPDYKILLPDYNNIEIYLHPLPKTVFFFFLKHPEGVLFKHLVDHREELFSIYKRLTNKESLDELYRSIDAIIDSTSNSINEKCSRIKESFYGAFTPTIADYYVITGASSTPKLIKLDRDLVVWEVDL